uniref:uncharacterized protein LOC109957869 n=1 Tax=Monopterus albus TaxID=43700 RepID=UPI0009B45C3C|nr:uncharacterized protein LOC109957869 [Monopterus albus]
MNDMQSKLKDGATKRKTALATVYQQIRDMLAQEERRAQTEVDRELEIGQTRLRDLMKRFTDNAETMRKAREDINSLLSQSQTPAFLQATFDLPKVVKSEPFMPRINLDSKTVTAAQAFSTALKEHLTEILNQPVETRLPIMKPSEGAGEKTAPVSGAASPASTGSQPESETQQPKVRGRKPRSHSSGRPPMRPYFQSVPVPGFMGSQPGWIPPQFFRGPSPNFNMTPPFNAAQWAQQDRMQPGAAGGSRPGARSDFTKKDHPKRHPPSEKSTKSHPQPKKN